MSRQIVENVIHCLLTDEGLRNRFAIDPIGTLLDLTYFRGFDLRQDEIDVLIRTDARTWFWSRAVTGGRVH
jgi:hypothetical protein